MPELRALDSARDATTLRGPTPPVQLKAITSARFLAAVHVALFHMVPGDGSTGLLPLLIGQGYTGVSFFFVLSGFILTYSHSREYESGHVSARRFYFARFARIYPVYLLSMIFAGFLGRALFDQRRHVVVYVVDLLMLQSWFIRMVGFFNGPGWTISCEMVFYLLFPVVVMRLRPRTRARAIGGVVGFWVLSLVAPLWCLLHTFGPHWQRWVGYWTTDLAFSITRIPVFQLPEFLAGISIGWMLMHFAPSRRASATLLLCGAGYVVGIFLLSARIPILMMHNGLLIPGYAAILLGLSGANVFSRTMSFGPFVLLGEASYVFYLAHHMFHHWVMKHFRVGETISTAAVEILALIPLSIGIHLALERPARRRLLLWWDQREQTRVVRRMADRATVELLYVPFIPAGPAGGKRGAGMKRV